MRYLKLFEEWNEEIMMKIGQEKDYLDLLDLLKKFNVPLDEWGKGSAKTVAHLYNEVKEGETILKEEGDKLVREVEFVGARVIYKKEDGEILRLYEDKQVFKDGRIRKRKTMPYSMAEKFKAGEDPKASVIRGMKEELGIEINKEQFVFYNRVRKNINDDYPGIDSYHTGHEFLVLLNDEQYDPEGYIERQPDKDVHFTWRPISKGKVSESYEEDLQNDILDKISRDGIESLTRFERKLLDAISKGDEEFLEDLKKREYEYNQILSGDIRDDTHIEMSNDELSEFNTETLWDLMEDVDVEHFVEYYGYPMDVVSFNWGDLPDSVKKDFMEYSKKYI